MVKRHIGSNDFIQITTESDIFIDKSLFIESIFKVDCDAIMILEPRKWGEIP
ncbi:MAG: hypothetical protein MRQ07_02110 [Candidatus Midichloria sp.]|nr:hypothetical protein [Candidatus Midichloria sp.]